MSKGWKGVLKDDTALSTCALAEGMVVTLMGSSEGVAKPAASTVSCLSAVVHAPRKYVARWHALGVRAKNAARSCTGLSGGR